MNYLEKIKSILLASILVLSSAVVVGKEPMKCDIGPIKKEYGKTNWLVYSCADKKSLVIVTDQGNPAMPFYFMYHPVGDSYKLYGEGTGNKIYTKAAFEEIKRISLGDIKKIVVQTEGITR